MSEHIKLITVIPDIEIRRASGLERPSCIIGLIEYIKQQAIGFIKDQVLRILEHFRVFSTGRDTN